MSWFPWGQAGIGAGAGAGAGAKVVALRADRGGLAVGRSWGVATGVGDMPEERGVVDEGKAAAGVKGDGVADVLAR